MTPDHLLASESEQELAREVARGVATLAGAHEAIEHRGARCREQRAGIVAWVAHQLGLADADLPLIAMAIAAYDEHHEARA